METTGRAAEEREGGRRRKQRRGKEIGGVSGGKGKGHGTVKNALIPCNGAPTGKRRSSSAVKFEPSFKIYHQVLLCPQKWEYAT
ncbi:hypothetical protein L1987_74564 [Smallanthus sonchifolius]|uniref:Uncharacterized protein n=1 Tax=Smallanthus sonchifolius TaxID=185202 RepID=A0ACB9A2Y0_9ASTR|nr:hypothetical protein L1987_74564 [Smallanthus sonchifolius]